MKIFFTKEKLNNLSPKNFLRRAGYALITTREGRVSFVRRLTGGSYPRFHIYVGKDCFDLHIDQKQASYKKHTAHSGEYNGMVVENEAERISSLFY